MKKQLQESLMFILGIVLLILLLYNSFYLPSLQYNIIWMVILSLNVSIVMAYLPFSAEFSIPGWAKFGGSAAILMGSMYLTFGLAEKGLQKENVELREKYDALGKQLETFQKANLGTAEISNDKKVLSKELASQIQTIKGSLSSASDYVQQARQFALGATTNTSDVRGCVSAAGRSQMSAEFALNQLATTTKILDAVPQ